MCDDGGAWLPCRRTSQLAKSILQLLGELVAPPEQRLKYVCVCVGSMASPSTLRKICSSSLTWCGGGIVSLFVYLSGHREIQSSHRKGAFLPLSVRNGVVVASGGKGESCPICGLCVLLSGSFTLPQYYFFLPYQGRKKNKIRCQSLLLCVGRVLLGVWILYGIEGRERRWWESMGWCREERSERKRSTFHFYLY